MAVHIQFKGNRYTSRGDNSVKIVFCLPSEKGSTLKGKNLLLGSKFFPFRVDPWYAGEQK